MTAPSTADTPPLHAQIAWILQHKEAQPELAELETWFKGLLRDPLFDRDETLSSAERQALAYERFSFLRDKVRQRISLDHKTVVHDPRKLIALTGLTGVGDTATWAAMDIHFLLALQSLMQAKNQTPKLQAVIDELVNGDAIGCFVLSEYNHGSNAISVETEATYDPVTDEFVLNTPNLPGIKWMPNTAHRQAKKKAIMFCRLLMDGEDHGVLPFLVPLNSDGIEIRLMGEEPGLMLDNAVTRLRKVRVPREFLLLDEHTDFSAGGKFTTTEPSRRKRLLNAIEALSVARASAGRAATAASQVGLLLAVNLASQRCVFAPKSEDIPLSEYSNFYAPILSAIGRVYASLCYYNSCVDDFDRDLGDTRIEQLGRNASLLKAMATEDAIDILTLCRKRSGSHGMFACNRIVEQLIAAHGLFSAEGESDILLLKLGRELLMKINYASPGSSSWTFSLGDYVPADLLNLLRARESKLVRTLRFDAFVKQRSAPLATIWKRSTNAVIDVARVHARRVMAEAFYEAVQRAEPDTDVRAALEGLFEVHCLDVILQDIGWFVSHGVVSSWRARKLAKRYTRAMDNLAPCQLDFVRAFEIDNDILRAPMGEDDIEHVFSYLLDEGPLPAGTVMQQYNMHKA